MTIDLRSDTVTHPTRSMRKAMSRAEVGDDGRMEDPTVSLLESVSAERFQKPAALFVTSGTMGNLVSVLALGRGGGAVIAGRSSHMYTIERQGIAQFGRIRLQTVADDNGLPNRRAIPSAIRRGRATGRAYQVLCLENTHARDCGHPSAPDRISALASLAHDEGASVHIDGARIFNAAVALNVAVSDLVRGADTASFCLSKGLGCPVGSVVVGNVDVIARARTARKAIGGTMRQAGVIAAAGIVALDTMVERLAEDHERARRLADGLNAVPGLIVVVERVLTNIVLVKIVRDRIESDQLVTSLRSRGLLCGSIDQKTIRLVTHYEIRDPHVDRALSIFASVMNEA